MKHLRSKTEKEIQEEKEKLSPNELLKLGSVYENLNDIKRAIEKGANVRYMNCYALTRAYLSDNDKIVQYLKLFYTKADIEYAEQIKKLSDEFQRIIDNDEIIYFKYDESTGNYIKSNK